MLPAIGIGVLFGLAVSFVVSFLFMLFGQAAAGGILSLFGESWLYWATAAPFMVAFILLAVYFRRNPAPGNRKLWGLSLLCALLVTWYSGTIGALTGEAIVRGGLVTETDGGTIGVNVEGVLLWGTLYAFLLLPVTVPVARLLIGGFHELLQKYGRISS